MISKDVDKTVDAQADLSLAVCTCLIVGFDVCWLKWFLIKYDIQNNHFFILNKMPRKKKPSFQVLSCRFQTLEER